MATVVAEIHLEAASTTVPVLINDEQQQEERGAMLPASSAAATATSSGEDVPAAASGPASSTAEGDAPAAGDGPSTPVIESDSQARNHFLSPSSSGLSIWQLLVGLLGLTAVISLALFTAGLASGQGLQPSWATTFAWSFTFMLVVIKGIQAQSAANINQATLGQGGVPRVLSKAARQALLTYFIHDLPKEGQGRSGDDDCDAAERDEEGGNCGGEGERTGDVAGKHDAAPVSSSPPVSLGAAVPVVTAGAPTTTSRKLWLEMEDDRERGLASKATKTFAVTEGTSARERPSSDDQQPGGASAPHTGEGAPACNERPRGPTHPDIEKGSSEWSTTEACIVCFGEYSRGDRLCRMPCGHTYHAVCIDEWLDRAGQPCCPLCKKDLRQELPGAGAAATGVSEGPAAENAGMEAV